MSNKVDFKDGEFIVPLNAQKMVCINKVFGDPFYMAMGSDGTIIPGQLLRGTFKNKKSPEFRAATPLEIKALLAKLLEQGFIWDFRWRKCVDVTDIYEEYLSPITE